jgi:hypothetical protein
MSKLNIATLLSCVLISAHVSELRSKRGVIGKTFDRILDQVFTRQFFAARGSK